MRLIPRLHTFSLVKTQAGAALSAMCRPPHPTKVPGLVHAECMARMRLGAPTFSPDRLQLGNLCMFASWESEEALDAFLRNTPLGRRFSEGWHVRMRFVRKWGKIQGFDDLPESQEEAGPADPVIAVTLARMRLIEVPRFIHWGRPVEELVRDHPGATLAMASMRLPRTVSTFSIWKTQKEMLGMVHGHSKVPRPERHARAMEERERKDFHFEFSTLRFKPLSEHGAWEGRGDYVPRHIP